MKPPSTIEYQGWTVCKTGPWGQGPVLLQALQILKNFDIASMDPLGEEFVHVVIEAIKLAYADREAYYGDPEFYDVPIDILLSEQYGQDRAVLISSQASAELRPGIIKGHEHLAAAAITRAGRKIDVLEGPRNRRTDHGPPDRYQGRYGPS